MVIRGLPESLCQCWAMDDVTEGSSPSGATLRHKLVFGRSVRTVTMMQILCRRDGREVCYRLGFYLPASV